MFELEDEKLGRVKVVNVTEARSSIASIMGDKESNYIITKNNKPIRVIINYDTFKKTIAISGGGVALKGSALKGLIQSKEKELRESIKEEKNEPVLPEPVLPEPILSEPILSEPVLPEPTLPEEPPPPVQEPMAQEPVTPYVSVSTPPPNSDYFNRFKKLYEAPRHDSLFQGGARIQNQQKTVSRNIPDNSPTPNRIPGSRNSDLPSIQDLLSELEEEKLSGEEDVKERKI